MNTLNQSIFQNLNQNRKSKKDLDFHYGENWLDNTDVSPATIDYVNRINQSSKEKPELLVAHAYTRYLRRFIRRTNS